MERLISKEETAARLGITLRTLDYWRVIKKGPQGKRPGRRVQYREAEVDAYIRELADDNTAPDTAVAS